MICGKVVLWQTEGGTEIPKRSRSEALESCSWMDIQPRASKKIVPCGNITIAGTHFLSVWLRAFEMLSEFRNTDLGGKKGGKGKAYWDARRLCLSEELERRGPDASTHEYTATTSTTPSGKPSRKPDSPAPCQQTLQDYSLPWPARVASQSVSEVRRCQGCRTKAEAKPRAASPVPFLLLWLLLVLEFNCRYCWVLCIFKKTKN